VAANIERLDAQRRATWLLVAVAAVAAAVQLTLGPLRLDYGWDETVYVSQVARHVPAAFFSAPRARGLTMLVAPVAMLTSEPVTVRLFLIAVSAIGLVLSFRVWVPVLGSRAVVIAALLFASLWQAQVYGSEVYPNYWIALLAVAAVGWAARAESAGRVALAWSAACLVGVTLLRPGDAAWLWLALVVAGWRHAPWRATRLALTSSIALLIGVVPWVVEAEVRFGGVSHRLAKSSATEGGLFPHLGFLYEVRAAYGPLLCRPCTSAAHPLVLSMWWVVAGALACWALWVNRHRPVFPGLTLSVAAAAAMAAPYMLLVGYSAPRFLLPAYGLGSLAVGHALVGFVSPDGRRRRLRLAGVAVALLGFATAEAAATHGISTFENARRDSYRLAAAALHAHGVTAPCLVVGRQSPPIGFEAGCASEGRAPVLTDPGDPFRRALAGSHVVAVLVEPGQPTPSYVAGWQRADVELEGTSMALYVHHVRRRCNDAC
jgi:hypothetical protein